MKRLSAWAPPILWLGLIVAATSIPNLDTSAYPNADKVFHLAAYVALAVLAVRAIHLTWGVSRTLLIWAALAGLAVAAADEYHEVMIPGRTAAMADFALNLAGYGVGLILGRFRFLKEGKATVA